MIKRRSWQLASRYTPAISLALGSFDAIHYGHQALLSNRILNLESWVLYFKKAPQAVYQPNFAGMVRSEAQRLAIFEDLKLDGAFSLDFSTEMGKMSGIEFLQALYQQLNIKTIFVGEDFRFGQGAKADVQQLQAWALGQGIKVEVIPLMPDLQTSIKYSSSALRKAVQEGNFKLIEQSSGYPYAIDLRESQQSGCDGKWVYALHSEQILPPAGRYECDGQAVIEIVNKNLIISTDPLEQLVLKRQLL